MWLKVWQQGEIVFSAMSLETKSAIKKFKQFFNCIKSFLFNVIYKKNKKNSMIPSSPMCESISS